jgi:hypothetical protein
MPAGRYDTKTPSSTSPVPVQYNTLTFSKKPVDPVKRLTITAVWLTVCLCPYRWSALLGCHFTSHTAEFTGQITKPCAFFTSATYSLRQLSAAGYGRVSPAKEPPYPRDMKLSGPKNHSGKSMQEQILLLLWTAVRWFGHQLYRCGSYSVHLQLCGAQKCQTWWTKLW